MKPILDRERNSWAVERSAAGGVLVDGREYYRAFYNSARQARSFILIAGWQFDSDVALLRGADSTGEDGEARFLPFLNSLCEKNPQLRIFILAWDYSALYAFEREIFQKRLFEREGHERVIFRMDGRHPVGASHHQKFVVIDGKIGFVGGQDICASRWDERDHDASAPERVNSDGSEYGPFHDVQAYMTGNAVGRLTELFRERWKAAFDEDLVLETNPGPEGPIEAFPGIPVGEGDIAISRTVPENLFDKGSAEEIRRLYLDAIDSAEHLIYIENQYFTSTEIFDALAARMKDPGRSRLQIVIILPKGDSSPLQQLVRLPKSAGALAEEVAFMVAQSEILKNLKQIAAETGHSLGIYYTAATDNEGNEVPVYIHSKLLLVDDRFLSVGSANTTNRSMGVDTELNISWEAGAEDPDLVLSIPRVRNSLLREHTGLEAGQPTAVFDLKTLVRDLDELAASTRSRLKQHPVEIFLDQVPLLGALKLKELSLDPSKPYPEMLLNGVLKPESAPLFASGILPLKRLMQEQSEKEAKRKPGAERRGLKLSVDV